MTLTFDNESNSLNKVQSWPNAGLAKERSRLAQVLITLLGNWLCLYVCYLPLGRHVKFIIIALSHTLKPAISNVGTSDR